MRKDSLMIIIGIVITLIGAITLPIYLSNYSEIKILSKTSIIDTNTTDKIKDSNFINENNVAVTDESLNNQKEQCKQDDSVLNTYIADNVDNVDEVDQVAQVDSNNNGENIILKNKQFNNETVKSQYNNEVSVNDEYIQQQINENRASIDDKDLETGVPIFNKIDMNVVYDLADDGFTEEEKAELSDYLKSIFTEDEYENASQLFYKYIGLIK